MRKKNLLRCQSQIIKLLPSYTAQCVLFFFLVCRWKQRSTFIFPFQLFSNTYTRDTLTLTYVNKFTVNTYFSYTITIHTTYTHVKIMCPKCHSLNLQHWKRQRRCRSRRGVKNWWLYFNFTFNGYYFCRRWRFFFKAQLDKRKRNRFFFVLWDIRSVIELQLLMHVTDTHLKIVSYLISWCIGLYWNGNFNLDSHENIKCYKCYMIWLLNVEHTKIWTMMHDFFDS